MATNYLVLLVASLGLGLAGCDEDFPGAETFGWSDDNEDETFRVQKAQRSSSRDEVATDTPAPDEEPTPVADEEPEPEPEPAAVEPEPEPEPVVAEEPVPEEKPMVCVYSEPFGALVSCSRE